MRNTFAREMTVFAKERSDVVLLSGDIGNRMFDEYKLIAPERFINCGIAEASMMSIASGMALSGLRPVVYTITPFLSSRCFEQIKIGIAYHNANVIIVGTGSGLSYAELGPTHHSLEDIGILSTLPGLRILAPCDSLELSAQLKESLSFDGPTYIRIGKKGEPNLIQNKVKTSIGKINLIKDGSDILIMGIGPILGEALEASNNIKSVFNKNIKVVSLGGIEPLDESFLSEMIEKKFKCWITLEEHGFNGGVGSKINNWLIKNVKKRNFDVFNLCTPNRFINRLGKQNYLRKELNLDSTAIFEIIRNYV